MILFTLFIFMLKFNLGELLFKFKQNSNFFLIIFKSKTLKTYQVLEFYSSVLLFRSNLIKLSFLRFNKSHIVKTINKESNPNAQKSRKPSYS